MALPSSGTGAELDGTARRPFASPSSSQRGFTLIELLVVVVIIGVVVAIALPNYVKVKDKAREADVKAGLHSIQLSLERFAVDNHGEYPPYLIGGDNAILEVVVGDDGSKSEYRLDTPVESARDPLIRAGYVDEYPRNPFIRNTVAVQQFQAGYGDPLRNSMPDSRDGGTRFGPYGTNMGQVLCDARWLQWDYYDPANGTLQQRYTWSNVQYEFYDSWAGPASRPYLPGSFMYKSMGELVPNVKNQKNREYINVGGQEVMKPKGDRDEVTYPLSLDTYLLGAWGGVRTKGQDILGEEPLVLFSFESSRRKAGTGTFFYDEMTQTYTLYIPPGMEKFKLMGIAPWTRGVNRAHVGPLWGSPYGPAPRGDEQLTNSNPNGLRDGLIIMLDGGTRN